MTENLTRKSNLVQEITEKSWFANPVGKQGYEIILLEKVENSGTRYYTSLKPGETLRFGERLFINYVAIQVDIRHARGFSISGTFTTRDRGKKVSIELNVRFHVLDARIVAMGTVDPLGEFQDKVIATLNRELQRYMEHDVTATLVERMIQDIGQVPHLGLTVEDVEVLSLDLGSQSTQHVVKEEDVSHSIEIESIRRRAELEKRRQEDKLNLEIKIDRLNQINISDLKTLMHEHPDIIAKVVEALSAQEKKLLDTQITNAQTSILDYLEKQKKSNKEIDPNEISKILRNAGGDIDKPKVVASGNNNDVVVIANEPPIPPKDNSDLQSDLIEKNYKVSISYPLLLSKRFDSVFLFQLYLPEHRSRVNKNIKAHFQENLRVEFVDQSTIRIGQKIRVEFYNTHFDFSKPVIKLVDGALTKIVFLGSPKDTCQTGMRNVRVSISNVETQQEIESFTLSVRVVDFAFDHISRPLVSRISAIVLGVGSFAMFLLTLLEQIDKTVGLTSGTAAGVLAAMVYANFYNLYQRIRSSSP